MALVTLACHDLHHGFGGVGGQTTRGLGTLRIADDLEHLTAQRAESVTVLTAALAESVHATGEAS